MAGWNDYPGAQLFVPAPMWDDPVQGAAKNCSCIAGMVSLAWVAPQFVSQNLTASTQAYLYKPAKILQQQTSKLWLDDAGKLVYVRSKDSAAPTNELWPAYYEKAYAKFVQNIANIDTNPVMTGGPETWLNFSTTPLYKMTGWTNNPTYNGTQTDILESFCTPISAQLKTAQTTCPGIAWTAGATAHSYSILGLYQDASKWVILRDPLREGAALPNKGRPQAASVTFATDTYINGTSKGLPKNIAVPLSSGTFGMSIADFKTYFTAFGFVGQKM